MHHTQGCAGSAAAGALCCRLRLGRSGGMASWWVALPFLHDVPASENGRRKAGPCVCLCPVRAGRGAVSDRSGGSLQFRRRRSCAAPVCAAATLPGDFSIPAAPILIPEGPWKEIEGCVCAPKGFKAQGVKCQHSCRALWLAAQSTLTTVHTLHRTPASSCSRRCHHSLPPTCVQACTAGCAPRAPRLTWHS